ncbi:Alpha/Beta hydrolase protein [Elsinoe ampelina]|uniref:Alpha/Beta hydrolase protein n=1 Tax=Elsinoe ampelina TaxID=302913 RepID=A0A6A6GKK6_9PEZI|nr:Alpha/Beta hydrolase protein [Elsinoe ampelina]
MSPRTTTHVVAPLAEHTHTVIFLHGKDSTATEFASEIFESQASDDLTLPQLLPGVRWVFPSAPTLRSARFDCDMTQWFDMWDVQNPDERWREQVVELSTSVGEVVGIIEREVAVVGREKVLVAGMSQGAAVGVHAVLRTGCVGFVGLSTWFALGEEVEKIAGVVGETRSLPVFLGHCEDDEVIPVSNGRRLCELLGKLGAEVEWREYVDGGHWLNEPQGVDDLVAFVKRVLYIQ